MVHTDEVYHRCIALMQSASAVQAILRTQPAHKNVAKRSSKVEPDYMRGGGYCRPMQDPAHIMQMRKAMRSACTRRQRAYLHARCISPRHVQQTGVRPMTLGHHRHPLGRALTIHCAFLTTLAIVLIDFVCWGMLRAAFSALRLEVP